MKGTGGKDTLTGGDGLDTIYGQGGDDLIDGRSGADVLDGQSGDDTLLGGDGNDYLVGGLGDDVIDGGAGRDWADYGDATSAVSVNLSTAFPQNTGGAGTDTLSGIEKLYGSAFGDLLTGDNSDNELVGAGGDDTLRGGLGRDTLVGGEGDDQLNGGSGRAYLDGGAGDDIYQVFARRTFISEAAVGGMDTVISQVSFALCDNVETLTLTGAEDLWGRGNGLDNLVTGNDGANVLFGQEGDDTLRGDGGDDVLAGGDGDDVLDGGDGRDVAIYSTSDCGVRVDLSLTGPQDTGRGMDTLIDVERLVGSRYGDALTGDTGGNILRGRSGADTLKGGAGEDLLQGGTGDDLLIGGAAGDILNGSRGTDTASYADAASGVTVYLSLKGLQDTGGSGIDKLVSIENLIGSHFDDTLGGNWAKNVLSGNGGDDRFRWTAVLDLDGDRVTDFSAGDVIDLKGIDANATQDGDQGFVQVNAFSHHAGELVARYDSGRHQTLIQIDVNGDAVADATLALDGNHLSHLEFAL